MTKVNVVVTCTNRKRQPVDQPFRLRAYRKGGTASERAKTWTKALKERPSPSYAAADLYSGDHWFVARDLASGSGVALWVCSAGYGLVPAEAKLKPYSATFTEENPDAVRRIRKVQAEDWDQEWWAALSKWRGPAPRSPRSLSKLASRHPDVPLLIVASPRYLRAMSQDLAAARKALASPEHLMVFSSAPVATLPLDFEENRMPSDARFQAELKGPLFSLNVRLARHVLRTSIGAPLRASAVRRRLQSELDGLDELPTYDRTPVPDAEVRTFIRREIKRDASASKTGLLRSFRSSGRACEQSRFGKLFVQVKEKSNG